MLITRARLCAAAAATALAVTGALVATAPAATASTHNGASTAHPYSNPVWYPLRAASTLDCAGTNPSSDGGCKNENNSDFKVDWITGLPGSRKSVPVYAAGAGIVHIGGIVHSTCGRTASNARGTWLWIDHGGSTVSIYMHFAATSARQLSVREGDYVTPRTKLGMTGGSGAPCIHGKPVHYLDFQIQHNAIWKGAGQLPGAPQTFATLAACYQGKRVNWPAQLPHHSHRSWHTTPKGTVVPASTSTCIPTGAPHTTGQPLARIHRGTHSLTLTWSHPRASAHVTAIRVQLRVYHSSSHSYSYSRPPAKTLSPRATRYSYSPLGDPQTTQARVAFYNHAGWSKWAGQSWK